MADMMGRGYVIEHCIAAFAKMREEKAYRAYISDALKVIGENTAKFAGGSYLKARWVDMIEPQKPQPKAEDDPRPCKDIAVGIFKRARGEKA